MMAADEPLVVRCAADPEVETALRCGRCDTPICPRCLVMTPVGARCRGCARLRSHPVYDVHVGHFLRGAGAGLAVALVGGFVLLYIPFLGFLGLLLLGYATGEAVTAAANRKRGKGLAAVAVIATLIGAVVPLALMVGAVPLLSPWTLFLLLGAVVAASRVR